LLCLGLLYSYDVAGFAINESATSIEARIVAVQIFWEQNK
jgi:hypothetical protein